MTETINLIFGCAALGMVLGSILLWTDWISALLRGEDPLPAAHRAPVPWGFVDILFAMAILFVLQVVFQSATLHFAGIPATARDPWTRIILIDASTSAILLGLVAMLAFISFRTGATLSDFGMQEENLTADLGLGARAFLMLGVPVFILQGILTIWYPSNHPLIDSVKQLQDPWLPLGVVAIAAIVSAPLVEELGFRVLLQGWLEGIASGPHAWMKAMVGSGFEPPGNDNELSSSPPSSMILESPVAAIAELPQQELSPEPIPDSLPPSLWPTLISSFLFAISHWSHGPDWIPLLFLALGLGYLYRQTHRVVPSIVVHFLLNATSMSLFALGLAIRTGEKP